MANVKELIYKFKVLDKRCFYDSAIPLKKETEDFYLTIEDFKVIVILNKI